jgi:hypothetical protein
MDQKSRDGNKEQSSVSFCPEPNGRNKSMGTHDRIPPDLANCRHSCNVRFADGAFGNFPLRPYQEGPASERSLSLHKRNLGQPPLLGRSGGLHVAARRSTSSAKEPSDETSAATIDLRAQHAPPASAAPHGDEDDYTKPAYNQAPPHITTDASEITQRVTTGADAVPRA